MTDSSLSFRQQLALIIVDKGAVAVLLLVAGTYANAWLDTYRIRQGEAAESHRHSRAELLRQLNDFYNPAQFLVAENDAWWRVVKSEYPDSTRRIADERQYMLPNQDSLLTLVHTEGQIFDDDAWLTAEIDSLVAHATIQRMLREHGITSRDAIAFGAPWPKGLGPALALRTARVREAYESCRAAAIDADCLPSPRGRYSAVLLNVMAAIGLFSLGIVAATYWRRDSRRADTTEDGP